jgi:hypothetical protein
MLPALLLSVRLVVGAVKTSKSTERVSGDVTGADVSEIEPSAVETATLFARAVAVFSSAAPATIRVYNVNADRPSRPCPAKFPAVVVTLRLGVMATFC